MPVLLAVTAVWAWSRDRPALAGVVAGLAMTGGALAAVVLLAMAALPGVGGARAVGRLLAAAVATVAGVAAVVALADPGTLTRPYAAWLRDGAGPGSPWYLATLAGHPGFEKWNDRRKSGELNLVVAKRFLVSLEGEKLTGMKQLQDFAGQVDFNKLAGLGK